MPDLPDVPEQWRDEVNLARGIVAGLVTEQVEARAKFVSLLGLGAAFIGLIGAFALDGVWRGLAILVVVVGLLAAFVVYLLRRLAVGAIGRFASPVSLGDKRELIAKAIDTADLPSGPITALRFLRRIRKGVGPEFERLRDILDELATGLR